MFEVKGITPQADPHAHESNGNHNHSRHTHSHGSAQVHA
jgi:hypothetical protein